MKRPFGPAHQAGVGQSRFIQSPPCHAAPFPAIADLPASEAPPPTHWGWCCLEMVSRRSHVKLWGDACEIEAPSTRQVVHTECNRKKPEAAEAREQPSGMRAMKQNTKCATSATDST